jgi:NAD(P)H-dependent FMN reductase
MMAPRTALLLVGSPKPGASSSGSLGAYLLEGLEKRGMTTQTLRVAKAVRSDEAVGQLRAAVAAADLVVLSFPLYVDSLPGPATRALELIAGRRTGLRRHLPVRVPRIEPQLGRDRDLPELRGLRRIQVGRRPHHA